MRTYPPLAMAAFAAGLMLVAMSETGGAAALPAGWLGGPLGASSPVLRTGGICVRVNGEKHCLKPSKNKKKNMHHDDDDGGIQSAGSNEGNGGSHQQSGNGASTSPDHNHGCRDGQIFVGGTGCAVLRTLPTLQGNGGGGVGQ
jgi:hypothetical protein